MSVSVRRVSEFITVSTSGLLRGAEVSARSVMETRGQVGLSEEELPQPSS